MVPGAPLARANADVASRSCAGSWTSSARAVVVDLGGLEFIDSSGIAMLFSLARRLGAQRQALRVVARSGEPVERVLELVEFDRAAPIYETVDDAVGALSRD